MDICATSVDLLYDSSLNFAIGFVLVESILILGQFKSPKQFFSTKYGSRKVLLNLNGALFNANEQGCFGINFLY